MEECVKYFLVVCSKSSRSSLVDGVGNVVVNPFISSLTLYWPKHSFYINLESDYQLTLIGSQNWIVEDIVF